MVEFRPGPAIRTRAGTLRYWIDDRGLPRQVEHLTAGGRAWRTIHPLEFGRVMDRRRPTRVRVQSRGKSLVLVTRNQQAMEVPEEWVDPERFGAVAVP